MWKRIGKDGERYWGTAGAGIFFTDGKKVLLLKRSEKGDGQGTWGLPGGKIEEDESPIDAARRECKEECGQIKGQRFDNLKEQDGLHNWTTFFFKVKRPFKCKLSDEHTDYKWFKINELKDQNLHPKLKKNLERHLSVVRKNFVGTIKFSEWVKFRESFQSNIGTL